jgi:hypothetical protein
MRAAKKSESAIIFLLEDELSDQELIRRALMPGFHFVIVNH